jgi:hypothetical protein
LLWKRILRMSLATFEGIVENGQIKLRENIQLPERTRVLVVVPETVKPAAVKIMSPRLANAADVTKFEMKVISHGRV